MAANDPTLPEMKHIAAVVSEGIAQATFPTGRFDGNAVRELFELAMALPDPAPRLLVDCTGLTFVPSGGLGILVAIRKRFLSNGGQLHVVLPDLQTRQSFSLAHLDQILQLFDAVDTARKAFR